MRVDELMTRDVVTVAPDTPLREVAELLVAHRISGVPVCNCAGEVVGVVSEQDVLYKELGPDERGGGPLARLAGRPDAAAVKAGARTAAGAMTSPALTIRPERRAAAAARLMVERAVNRLPVVDRHGRLVGIVTRADLVRAFARSDAEIRDEIVVDVVGRSLWIPSGSVTVEVERGEVTLGGSVDARSVAEILPRLVSAVPGVISVRSELSWRQDDVARRRGILSARGR